VRGAGGRGLAAPSPLVPCCCVVGLAAGAAGAGACTALPALWARPAAGEVSAAAACLLVPANGCRRCGACYPRPRPRPPPPPSSPAPHPPPQVRGGAAARAAPAGARAGARARGPGLPAGSAAAGASGGGDQEGGRRGGGARRAGGALRAQRRAGRGGAQPDAAVGFGARKPAFWRRACLPFCSGGSACYRGRLLRAALLHARPPAR
jgi:hypothetical protein